MRAQLRQPVPRAAPAAVKGEMPLGDQLAEVRLQRVSVRASQPHDIADADSSGSQPSPAGCDFWHIGFHVRHPAQRRVKHNKLVTTQHHLLVETQRNILVFARHNELVVARE
jgi:hypothetical protein